MGKQVSPKLVSLTFGVLVLCFLVAFYAVGWVEPTADAPIPNVPAPLNTSGNAQIKVGGLILNTGGAEFGLAVDQGKVGIGTIFPEALLEVDAEELEMEGVRISKDGDDPTPFAYLHILNSDDETVFKVHEDETVGIRTGNPGGKWGGPGAQLGIEVPPNKMGIYLSREDMAREVIKDWIKIEDEDGGNVFRVDEMGCVAIKYNVSVPAALTVGGAPIGKDLVRFGTLDINSFTVKADGKVGIGVSNPVVDFQVGNSVNSFLFGVTNEGTIRNSGWAHFEKGLMVGLDSEDSIISTDGGPLILDAGVQGVGIQNSSPISRSSLEIGVKDDNTNSYLHIDSESGNPPDEDCDQNAKRGRMIYDYANNRLYICGGASRGWDYINLND